MSLRTSRYSHQYPHPAAANHPRTVGGWHHAMSYLWADRVWRPLSPPMGQWPGLSWTPLAVGPASQHNVQPSRGPARAVCTYIPTCILYMPSFCPRPCHSADADTLAEGPHFWGYTPPLPLLVVSQGGLHRHFAYAPSGSEPLLLMLEVLRWPWLKEDAINELSLFLLSRLIWLSPDSKWCLTPENSL